MKRFRFSLLSLLVGVVLAGGVLWMNMSARSDFVERPGQARSELGGGPLFPHTVIYEVHLYGGGRSLHVKCWCWLLPTPSKALYPDTITGNGPASQPTSQSVF